MMVMVDLKKLGDIKEKRKSAGLAKAYVAKYCGVSLEAYYRWEKGITKSIKAEHFDKLCEVLNVKAS